MLFDEQSATTETEEESGIKSMTEEEINNASYIDLLGPELLTVSTTHTRCRMRHDAPDYM